MMSEDLAVSSALAIFLVWKNSEPSKHNLLNSYINLVGKGAKCTHL